MYCKWVIVAALGYCVLLSRQCWLFSGISSIRYSVFVSGARFSLKRLIFLSDYLFFSLCANTIVFVFKILGLVSGMGTIFMLHRVREERENQFAPNIDMSVSPIFLEKFVTNAQQSGYLFVGLDELSERLKHGSGEKLLSLTFDDGYRDNFIVAYPILKSLGVPFTIYVTTSFPDGMAVLWWDALEQLIRDNTHIVLADNRVLACCTTQEKLDSFVFLREMIMAFPSDNLGDRVNALFKYVCFDWQKLSVGEFISWDDICNLARDPLATIGAHTLTHPDLSKLSLEEACFEMRDSREQIESRICGTVSHFCYPFGTRSEVGNREFELARKLGFHTATTTRWGNIFRAHSLHMHELPRVPLTNSFTWDCFRTQSLRRFCRGRVVTA